MLEALDGEIEVPAGRVTLAGRLTLPDARRGVVVFAQGTGGGRHSPRDRFVAASLNESGIGTLLVDLLTPEERREPTRAFDTDTLATRLVGVSGWLAGRAEVAGERLGYFGSSAGAAAALQAAALGAGPIGAVVCRGGRPDLAAAYLPLVKAPTLLIVGGEDHTLLRVNRDAQGLLRCKSHLAVVPGATHLFEEPGALEEVARLAVEWLLHHLAPAGHARPATGS